MEKMIENLSKAILNNIHKDDVVGMVINVYNSWQEGERDGVDYLFNLEVGNDLIDCIKGGADIFVIEELRKDQLDNEKTPYFFFGYNHSGNKCLYKYEVVSQLADNMNSIVSYMLAYPWEYNCRTLYTNFVTNKIIENV